MRFGRRVPNTTEGMRSPTAEREASGYFKVYGCMMETETTGAHGPRTRTEHKPRGRAVPCMCRQLVHGAAQQF